MNLERLSIVANMMEENEAFFQEGFFTMKGPSEEEIESFERQLGCKIPESFLWFVRKYGYGGCYFEILGYGINGKAIFVTETLKQRENDLPQNLIIIENCDEYYNCINADDGSIVTWSRYDKDGVIKAFDSFEDYWENCVKNAIENLD